MNDTGDLFFAVAARNRSARMDAQDERRPGTHPGTSRQDRAETRESGGGSVAPGYAGGISTCPIWCGATIDGVVNYCCPSCREICEGFDA